MDKKRKTTGVKSGGGTGEENIFDFKGRKTWKAKYSWDFLTVQHLGWILPYTAKVDPNSQTHFYCVLPSFTPKHTAWKSNFQTIWDISWRNLLQGYRAELRMMYCACIFLQNRSKCSQWHTRIHMSACAKAHLHTYWINLHSCLLFLSFTSCASDSWTE